MRQRDRQIKTERGNGKEGAEESKHISITQGAALTIIKRSMISKSSAHVHCLGSKNHTSKSLMRIVNTCLTRPVMGRMNAMSTTVTQRKNHFIMKKDTLTQK